MMAPRVLCSAAHRRFLQDPDQHRPHTCHTRRTRARRESDRYPGAHTNRSRVKRIAGRELQRCDRARPVPRRRVRWPLLLRIARTDALCSCSRYFQCGVSNFLMGRYDLSYKDFEEAYLYLRGNESM